MPAARRRFIIATSVMLFVLISVGAYVAANWVADTPPAFNERVTYEQAAADAEASGRVVVALVTADFCIACQNYKRGALADEDVNAWIKANAESVYLTYGEDDADIERLGVETFPVTLVRDGDETVAVHEGAMNAEELLKFLRDAAAQAKGDAETS